MLNSLVQTTKEVGKSSETLAMPDGSRLLFLPYGARVLGLFAAEGEENFFWTNPQLQSAETARPYFAGSGWHNTGGDRTWVAPELDTFYTDATLSQYLQPRQLDNCEYRLEPASGGCRLSREMTLGLARSGGKVRLRLTKWFGPAADPLRDMRELAGAAGSVDYAGYTQRVTLESLESGSNEPPAVGIWNLIQLPPGGEMLVPFYGRATPQSCFGSGPAESVILEDRLLRMKINFRGTYKIAMKAAVLCGRAGYVYGSGDRWSLVVRNFAVNPSGTYVDVQKLDEKDFGYAFQICRVDQPEYGDFCEMEYHAPALGLPPETLRSEDISQVWAFRGPRAAIDAIARTLLGGGL